MNYDSLRLFGAVIIAGSLTWGLCRSTPAASEPGLELTAHTASSDGCGDKGPMYCPTSAGDGYIYIYDPSSKVVVAVPTGSYVNDPGATYEYAVTPACITASPTNVVNCVSAAQYCALNGASGVHEDVWRRQTAPGRSPWQTVGQICTGGGPPAIPVQQILGDVAEYERDHMPVPTPNVQPNGVAIVNLPVLVSVDQPGPQIMQVQQPVPGQLVATPTFSWRFDDGTVVTGAGVPYDGTDPRTMPTHYVSHTYTAAQAQASVTLTVTWNATFTAAGQTFTIAPLVMPPITTTFSVHEARSVLVNG